jgi:hypothetical protein
MPNDNIKRYKFSNGLEASQEELTLNQDYLLMDIISGAETDNVTLTEMSVSNAIKLLSENRLVEKALAVIFNIDAEKDENSFDKLSGLKNSELREVINDFFILNPLAGELLKNFAYAADFQSLNSKSSNTDSI